MPKINVFIIKEKFFFTDIRARLYRIALDLADDPNYSKEHAIKDIDAVCDILGESTFKVGDDCGNK